MAEDRSWSEPAGDLGAVTASLARLRRDREGVPMFLVLEDLAPAGSPAAATGPAAEGPALAELAEHYRRRMFPPAAQPGERETAAILEVLAAAHFRGAGQ